MFSRNKEYSRQEIQSLVGGELQTYLPQKAGVILAGCFNFQYNPDAPVEIQAGNPVKVAAKAKLLSEQPNTVFPVFLKEREKDRKYKFVGYYKCVGHSTAKDKIAAAERKSSRHGELSRVLYLEEV